MVTSRPILMQVVKNLNLNVEYFNTGEIKDSQLFTKVPISGEIITYDEGFVSSEYHIKKLKGDEFTLESEKYGKFSGKMNMPLKLDFGIVILRRNRQFPIKPEYKIIFSNPIEKVKKLEKTIQVDLPDEKALLMDISLVGAVPQKSESILDEVTRQYNLDGQRKIFRQKIPRNLLIKGSK